RQLQTVSASSATFVVKVMVLVFMSVIVAPVMFQSVR
ncbi:hypothetical protein TeGR_g7647, partial [Tetraparma gracilis]